MAQQQAIHKFVLGNKELDGKVAEFQYDKGWYSITDIQGEERNVIYKSKNAQEAYMKWNVYIGRKKERPVSEERRKNASNEGEERQNRGERGSGRDRDKDKDREERHSRGERGGRDNREGRDNRGDRARGDSHKDRDREENRGGRRDRRRSRSDRNRRYRESAEQKE